MNIRSQDTSASVESAVQSTRRASLAGRLLLAQASQLGSSAVVLLISVSRLGQEINVRRPLRCQRNPIRSLLADSRALLLRRSPDAD
jgi:hypothetical protein